MLLLWSYPLNTIIQRRDNKETKQRKQIQYNNSCARQEDRGKENNMGERSKQCKNNTSRIQAQYKNNASTIQAGGRVKRTKPRGNEEIDETMRLW